MSNPDFETFDFGPPLDIKIPEVSYPPSTHISLQYGVHAMSGKLYLVSPEEFAEFHSRFNEISPTSLPKLSDANCEPWVLLNSMLGLTWIHADRLPVEAATQWVLDVGEGKRDPSFAAVTDNLWLFNNANDLGYCDTMGKLALVGPAAAFMNKLIIALPSHRWFHRTRSLISTHIEPIPDKVFDYPPMPVDPAIISIIDRINAARKDPTAWVDADRPKKIWLKHNFFDLQTGKGYLPQDHGLYRHRGNRAVFTRDVWHALCYPISYSENEAVEKRPGGGVKIPEPYFQRLFPDLQARARVEDAKYRVLRPGDNQHMVA